MKIKQEIDNGNVADIRIPQILSQGNHDSQWIISNSSTSLGVYDNANSIENYHSEHNRHNSIYQSKNLEDTANIKTDTNFYFEKEGLVCNNQYSINRRNNINFDKSSKQSELENLEGATTVLYSTQNNCFEGYVLPASTPIEEEQVFEQSDTDEMSEEVIRQVPLGIVNPNYPGFQHLAHTLQDYSSRIENFYHSENDMTDDDVEITDLTEAEPNQNTKTVLFKNNNNGNENSISTKDVSLKAEPCLFREKLDSNTINDIPDLLKIVSNINNNAYDTKLSPESNYSDTDIENNFHTGDIIGDFNKEIADEIKELLNYNINIQDDLEELRKDIKEKFSKPIETTINNISDVVNHVIKKLVEIKSDEESENIETDTFFQNKYQIVPDNSNTINENEKIYKTEMDVSRPTFLVLESNVSSKITDAFLSDGKDELKFYNGDYDTETLSNNVENTIKQLSTELRKIIPKLDEMREQDRLWATCKSDITTDSNFNKISSSSEPLNITSGISKINQSNDKNAVATTSAETSVTQFVKRKLETKVKIDQIKEKSSAQEIRKAQKQSSSVRRTETEDYDLDSFDVYNIETALPKLDFDAIENHLRAAKEEERRKRNDREEIRRRLAMGVEADEFYSIGHTDRPGKKPSLHSRLQNGKNLQICFMNEAASDNESQTSELEKSLSTSNKNLSRSSIFSKSNYSLNNHPYQTRPLSVSISKHEKINTIQSGGKLRPTSLSNKPTKSRSTQSLGHIELKESDFNALQATLQTEARMALAQAKELARIQMERERAGRAVSPVTEMLRRSLDKACAPLAADRRRLSRQLLTDMNVAQLQVIVNELHSQIESLNDSLVKLLMARDELHMSQDSMLVDIEDLTRYFGVKEQTKKTKGSGKSGMRRLTSLVTK